MTRLVVEHDVEKRAVNLQAAFYPASVVDKAHLAEAVHEETDSRTGCANHFRQSFLADLGNDRLRGPFLAEVREQEKDSGQPFFAGVEQLINQVFFVADIATQQIGNEQVRKRVLPMESVHHGLFLDTKQLAVRQRSC